MGRPAKAAFSHTLAQRRKQLREVSQPTELENQMNCFRCEAEFSSFPPRGYCDECVKKFRDERNPIHRRQRPAPGVFADGKFAESFKCPQTISDETGDTCICRCGLCGSDDIESGYGLGSGYGMGSYNWCHGCNSFLDFSEDCE